MKTILVAVLAMAWSSLALANEDASTPAGQHPAAAAYAEAITLLESDPEAAAKRAEAALSLLDKDTPAAERMELHTLMALAVLKANPKSRRASNAVAAVIEERDKMGLADTPLAARACYELTAWAARRKEWSVLTEYGSRTEKAMLAVAPDNVDAQAIAITYQGIGLLQRRDTGRSKRNRVTRAQEALRIFERGIALYPQQESWETFNPHLASLITWRLTASIYYQDADSESASAFLASDERVSFRYPERDIPQEECKIEIAERKPPKYDRDAAQQGYIGATVLLFDLDPEGHVINLRPLASAPDEYFTPAALKAVKNWRYKIEPGTPAEYLKGFTVHIDFRLG